MNIYLILFLCVAMTGSITAFAVTKRNQLDIEKQKALISKTIQEEYQKKCKFVFTKCREKSISSFDTPEKLEILKIIANSYGIEDIEEAKECYYLGKPLVENAEIKKKNEMLDELRRRDQREFDDAKRRSDISGKEKYISYLEKLYRDALKSAEPSKNPENDFEYDMFNIFDEPINKKEDMSLHETYSTLSAYKSVVNKHKDTIDKFNGKICDESNIEEKFSHLKFSKVKLLVLKSKNIRVSGFVSIDEDMQLLGSDALLDGSFKVNILDSNDNVIGCGYYSTGSFNGNGALIESGFTKNEKRFSAICIIQNYMQVNKNEEYRYKIEPVNMWLIEK